MNRPLLVFAVLALLPACQQSPEQQQAAELRAEADDRGDLIRNQADGEADRLEQQAADLDKQADAAGGMTAERLHVRADALKREAKIVRKQADLQADAIREGADARIKASQSR